MLDPDLQGWAMLALAGPPIAACGVWDLRRMRIPNWLNAVIAALFVPLGLAFLGLEETGLRLAAGLVVLGLGFALFALGKMGGGDVKMLAACAPYVAWTHAALAVQLLALTLLAGLAIVLGLRKALSLAGAGEDTGWHSLRPRARFPMGISIAAAMLIYLALVAVGRI